MLFCAHPWCWGSVGLRGRSILLPTKTSRLESQLFGRSAVTDRIGSQVDVTRKCLVSFDPRCHNLVVS